MVAYGLILTIINLPYIYLQSTTLNILCRQATRKYDGVKAEFKFFMNQI